MKRVPKSFSMVAIQELHTAVTTGDAAIVREMLEAGATVDQIDEFGNTALHRAAWQGDASLVETLLSFGAKADVQRPDGQTPLDLAELRARGVGSNPPRGLSEEMMRGDLCGVSTLLRDRTPGNDVILQCSVKKDPSGQLVLSCKNIGGSEVASVSLESSGATISMIQEKLARQLQISQTRLRLVMPDAKLPSDVENLMLVNDLFSGYSTLSPSKTSIVKVPSKEEVGRVEKDPYFALNQLSCSSVSTCASEGQMDILEATFEQLSYSMRL